MTSLYLITPQSNSNPTQSNPAQPSYTKMSSTDANPSEPTLLLYTHPVSSYAQKIRIALREKSVPFRQEQPRGLGSGFRDATDPRFAAANPRMEVPVLIDTTSDLQIFDSTIILEYLEERYPTPALLPSLAGAADSARAAAARERAKARMIEEICDTQYEGLNWGMSEMTWFKRAEGERAAALRDQVRHQTKQVQAWLSEKLGDSEWFGGEHGFGWADICVAPLVNRSVWYGFGPEAGSLLQKWHARVSERPSVKATFEEFEAGMKATGGFADALRQGLLKREYRDHRLEWMVKSGAIDIVLEGLEKRNIRFSWPDPLE